MMTGGGESGGAAGVYAPRETRFFSAPRGIFARRGGACARASRRRGGFSLAEAVLALALFAASAFAVSQICYNCVYPLSMADSDPAMEADFRRGIEAVLGVSDYDSLSDEIDVESFGGETLKASGEAEPTEVADLFKLDITVRGRSFERKRTVFVVRPGWYEISTERDDIITDRTDYLEDLRMEAAK